MMYFTEVQSAFDTKLNSFSPALSIAWENTKYVPVLGTAFVRPQLNITNSNLAIVTERQQKVIGNYIIDIFMEAEKGTKASNELAGRLFAHFSSTNTLTGSDINIFIGSINKGSASLKENWWQTSLVIEFMFFK